MEHRPDKYKSLNKKEIKLKRDKFNGNKNIKHKLE